MTSAMYKVFINDKTLYLSSEKNIPQLTEKNILKLDYKSEKEIHTALDMLSFNKNISGASIFYPDLKQLWEKFCEQFKVLEAAGGLVLNEKKELLMIYRLEKWDLPKGKIENNEQPKEAALREVCEETGVCHCEIINESETTFHTYTHKEKKILKKTYWFEMKCTRPVPFKLQENEGITDAKWMGKDDLAMAMKGTYPSIKGLLKNLTDT